MSTYQLYHGDCLEFMRGLDAGSVDAIVTDPPYGLGFMGKDWDHGVPGIHFWKEALRVAKPGAHLLAFGGTRTFHRLAVSIEDAGWEIRDTVMWVYGQGFPKSHDVSKAIDREAGAEREIGETSQWAHVMGQRPKMDTTTVYGKGQTDKRFETLPSTPAAQQWEGWGTALKPAWEPIIVARKPLEGTVAQNVQRYGTGAMNIDACRIDIEDTTGRAAVPSAFKERKGGDHTGYFTGIGGEKMDATGTLYNTKGRWPANLIHDGSDEVLAGFPTSNSSPFNAKKPNNPNTSWKMTSQDYAPQGGFSDTGSAARFFYCAKASKRDRDEGLEEFEIKQRQGTRVNSADDTGKYPDHDVRDNTRNNHPTVKPTDLMRYLCKLVTPPNGYILDPFMGSGSTGKAAMLEGFNFIGAEIDAGYFAIAEKRIREAAAQPALFHLDAPKVQARQEAFV